MANRWADNSRVHVIALLVSVGIAYFNALAGPFQFDDHNVIRNNPAVHSWDALWQTMPGIRAALKATYVANWLSDDGPWGFHLVNIVIHAINASLVYGLMVRWLPRLTTSSNAAKPVALLVALLFALHPAQTEAVTYISGRSSSLMAMFYLAAMWFTEALNERQHRTLAACVGVVLFFLALASKEIAWTLPFALALRDRVIHQRSWALALRTQWPLFAALIGAAFAVVLIPGYWRLVSASLDTRTLGENLLTQVDGIWYLLTRPLLLLELNIDPSLPEHTQWTGPLALKFVVIAALLSAAFVVRARYRAFAFGVTWFFLHLIPTNSVIPRYDIANDKQLYLAMLGPALIAAALIAHLAAYRVKQLAAAVLCATLGIATIVRNMDYRTEVTLWEATVRKSHDKARVWNNLGFVRQKAGNREGAKHAYDRALEIDPEHVNARINRYTLE